MGATVDLIKISKFYKDYQGKIFTALNDVSISINKEELVAFVGETGSGKTTLGRISTGLTRPSVGQVKIDGIPLTKHNTGKEHWRKVQLIHQDPYSALDTLMTVSEILERPLKYLKGEGSKENRIDTIKNFLPKIGLEESILPKYIRELSGGERQRVLLGRAFIINPEYTVADEPTTMLDFIHRGEIINLIKSLKDIYKATMLLITHDLGLASSISDRVVVMHKGRIVEVGNNESVVGKSGHPYTVALNEAIPEKIMKNKGKSPFWNTNPDSTSQNTSVGCDYSLRCPFAQEKCYKEVPELVEIAEGHSVSCFYPR